MDMNEFSTKIADFAKWDSFLKPEEIEKILEYQSDCVMQHRDAMVLRFLFEKISTDNIMYPFYVWVVFHMDEAGVTSISVHQPIRPSSWLEVPEELKGNDFLPIESMAFSL